MRATYSQAIATKYIEVFQQQTAQGLSGVIRVYPYRWE